MTSATESPSVSPRLLSSRAVNIAWAACLFVVSFSVYELSLASSPTRFASHQLEKWNMFGADSNEQTLRGDWSNTAAGKHPLFAVAGEGLFLLTEQPVFHRLSPANPNFALAFPAALFGAADVALMYLLLVASYPDRRVALAFTTLYAVSAGKWVFSSIPETYSLTALCTTGALSVMFLERHSTYFFKSSVATALACYASPQQILLTIVPAFLRLRIVRTLRQGLDFLLRFGVVIVLLFVVPYMVFLKYVSLGWRFAERYLGWYGHLSNLVHARWYATTVMNMFVYGTVGPVVDQNAYARQGVLTAARLAGWSWRVTAGAYVGFVLWSVLGLRTLSMETRRLVAALGLFVGSYVLFFVYFNPTESFIYSLPILPAWIFLLHQSCAHRASRRSLALPALIVLVLAIAINNAVLLQSLRHP